jgi:hypothetical protein
MATKVIGFDKLKASLKNKLKRLENKKALLEDIGETALKNMKASVRLGKNPTTGQKYPPLKDSTIDQREYLEDFNPTSSFYRSQKSNNHFTGQLADSLGIEVTQNNVEIGVQDDSRNPYKGPKGTFKDTPTNSEIAEHLADGGRPVIGINKKTKTIVKNKVIAEINRQFKEN